MDIAALKAELLAGHPDTGAYNANDALAAAELNVVNRNRNRTSMSGREVAAEIVDADYDGLTEEKKSQVLALTSGSDIDPFGFAANVVKDIFGDGSATVTALAAARVETVSRATEIGIGLVKVGYVEQARA